jgi:hypothetical protein
MPLPSERVTLSPVSSVVSLKVHTVADFLRRHLEQGQGKINELERQLENVQIPSDLRQFESWCESKLAGRVVLLRRAYDGVNRSRFHDSALIYRALLLLRDRYVPMRRKGWMY